MKNVNKLTCSAAAVLLASCIAAPVMAGHMDGGFGVGIGIQAAGVELDGTYTDSNSKNTTGTIGSVKPMPVIDVQYVFGNNVLLGADIVPLKAKVKGRANNSAQTDKDYHVEMRRPLTAYVGYQMKLQDSASVYGKLGYAHVKLEKKGDITLSDSSIKGPMVAAGLRTDIGGAMSVSTELGLKKYSEFKATGIGAGNGTAKADPKTVYGSLTLGWNF